LPNEIVYAGFSLGVLPAQMLAQTRPGATSPRRLAETIETAELFLYPGDRHLFADSSLADHDESAATMPSSACSASSTTSSSCDGSPPDDPERPSASKVRS
jgi:hypothetical protein